MHVFELYERIRKKPGMFIDGEKSLKRLCAFMDGYLAGVDYQAGGKRGQVKATGHEDLRKFNSWVAENLAFQNQQWDVKL